MSTPVYIANVAELAAALAGGSTVDREIIVSEYRALNAGTGYSVDDKVVSASVYDVTTTPSLVTTIWLNATTGATISAPTMSDLAYINKLGSTKIWHGSGDVSTMNPLPVQPPASGFFAVRNTTEEGYLSSMDGKLPAKGLASMSGSQPVVIAKDQIPVPVFAGVGVTTGQTSETLVSVNDAVTIAIQPEHVYSFCLQVPVNTAGATWAVQFEKYDGSSWTSASVRPKTLIGSNTPTTSATDIGLWTYQATDTDQQLRMRLSAISGLAGGLRGYIDCLSISDGIINLPFRAGLTADMTTNTWFMPPVDMSGLVAPIVNLGGFAGTSQVLTPKSSGISTMTPTTNATNTIMSLNLASSTGAPASTITAAGEYRVSSESRYIGIALTFSTITTFTVYGLFARVGYVPTQVGVGVGGAGSPTNVPSPSASSGGVNTFHHLISAATTNATSVKASAGSIGEMTISNNGAAACYFKLYQKASSPIVGTDTPISTIMIPAGATVTFPFGIHKRLSTGIAYAITGGMAVADTTAVGAAQVSVHIGYI